MIFSTLKQISLVISAVFLFQSPLTQAIDFTFCIPPKSPVHDYSELLLELALSTEPHDVKTIVQPQFNYRRLVRESSKERSPCTVVIVSSESNTMSDGLKMVPIPLTKGLLSARVLIYKEHEKLNWLSIKSLEDVKNNFIIGSGTSWLSTKLLEHEGFTVAPALNLTTLWRMFNIGRFELLHRGFAEAYSEQKIHKDLETKFIIDDKFLIVYKADVFFFVKEEDKTRLDILTTALKKLHDNGKLHQHVINNFFPTDAMTIKGFNNRKKLVLSKTSQKSLPIKVEHIPDDYWFDGLYD